VKYATKGSKGSKTYNSTEEDIICLGSSNRRLQKKLEERFIFVQNPLVSIIILLELSATSPALKNTSPENTERRSTSAISAPRNTPFTPTGKLTPKPAAPENTDVTAVLSSPGAIVSSLTGRFAMH
jgi:hypothetical protein